MKYFKNATGDVFAYETEEDSVRFGSSDLIAMTDEEVEAIINRQAGSGVPDVVSRFQARAALYKSSMLESAELAVSNSDQLTKLAWADAQEFRRDSPILQSIAQALDLTSDDLDDLFKTASQIIA